MRVLTLGTPFSPVFYTVPSSRREAGVQASPHPRQLRLEFVGSIDIDAIEPKSHRGVNRTQRLVTCVSIIPSRRIHTVCHIYPTESAAHTSSSPLDSTVLGSTTSLDTNSVKPDAFYTCAGSAATSAWPSIDAIAIPSFPTDTSPTTCPVSRVTEHDSHVVPGAESSGSTSKEVLASTHHSPNDSPLDSEVRVQLPDKVSESPGAFPLHARTRSAASGSSQITSAVENDVARSRSAETTPSKPTGTTLYPEHFYIGSEPPDMDPFDRSLTHTNDLELEIFPALQNNGILRSDTENVQEGNLPSLLEESTSTTPLGEGKDDPLTYTPSEEGPLKDSMTSTQSMTDTLQVELHAAAMPELSARLLHSPASLTSNARADLEAAWTSGRARGMTPGHLLSKSALQSMLVRYLADETEELASQLTEQICRINATIGLHQSEVVNDAFNSGSYADWHIWYPLMGETITDVHELGNLAGCVRDIRLAGSCDVRLLIPGFTRSEEDKLRPSYGIIYSHKSLLALNCGTMRRLLGESPAGVMLDISMPLELSPHAPDSFFAHLVAWLPTLYRTRNPFIDEQMMGANLSDLSLSDLAKLLILMQGLGVPCTNLIREVKAGSVGVSLPERLSTLSLLQREIRALEALGSGRLEECKTSVRIVSNQDGTRAGAFIDEDFSLGQVGFIASLLVAVSETSKGIRSESDLAESALGISRCLQAVCVDIFQ